MRRGEYWLFFLLGGCSTIYMLYLRQNCMLIIYWIVVPFYTLPVKPTSDLHALLLRACQSFNATNKLPKARLPSMHQAITSLQAKQIMVADTCEVNNLILALLLHWLCLWLRLTFPGCLGIRWPMYSCLQHRYAIGNRCAVQILKVNKLHGLPSQYPRLLFQISLQSLVMTSRRENVRTSR